MNKLILNCKEDTVLNRLHIGHIRFTHGVLMAREEPSICQTCRTVFSVKHIIYNQEQIHHKLLTSIPHLILVMNIT